MATAARSSRRAARSARFAPLPPLLLIAAAAAAVLVAGGGARAAATTTAAPAPQPATNSSSSSSSKRSSNKAPAQPTVATNITGSNNNKPAPSNSSNKLAAETTTATAAPPTPPLLLASPAALFPPPPPPSAPLVPLDLSAAPVHGAYLGCFRAASLPHVNRRVGGSFPPSALDRCTPACRQGNHTFSAIEAAPSWGAHACLCTSAIPPESARAPEADCAARKAGAAALFYHHVVSGQGCRLANVPFRRENFAVHYGEHNLAWTGGGPAGDPTTLTVRMEGTSGARLATADGKHLYGAFQVEGLISDASGAVTAFYTRSSDDYNLANHGVFSEIDFEFLNGHPGTRSSLWLNSYTKGVSGGERSLPVARYASLLALPPGKNASNSFLTYGFSWQPDRVTWSANGVPLEKKEYGQDVSWVDMRGITFHRRYQPPDEPQHVSFSMWADGDQTRAFGGPLEWGRSPFYSSFRELRRVLCDVDAASSAAPKAPAWLYSDLRADAFKALSSRPPQFTAAAAAAAARNRGVVGGGVEGQEQQQQQGGRRR